MKEKMQNLVKLLNEYEKWKSEKYGRGNYVWCIDKDIGCIFASRFPDGAYICEDESRAVIICKGYNFVKWLVQKNKIDIERLHKIVDYRLEIKENYANAHDYNSDCLLMLLSISNSPIHDLVSYLK